MNGIEVKNLGSFFLFLHTECDTVHGQTYVLTEMTQEEQGSFHCPFLAPKDQKQEI